MGLHRESVDSKQSLACGLFMTGTTSLVAESLGLALSPYYDAPKSLPKYIRYQATVAWWKKGTLTAPHTTTILKVASTSSAIGPKSLENRSCSLKIMELDLEVHQISSRWARPRLLSPQVMPVNVNGEGPVSEPSEVRQGEANVIPAKYFARPYSVGILLLCTWFL